MNTKDLRPYQAAELYLDTGVSSSKAECLILDYQAPPAAMRACDSLSLYQQTVGRVFRLGTFEFTSTMEAFHLAERAAYAGHPVKLGKEPGKPWSVTVEAKPAASEGADE